MLIGARALQGIGGALMYPQVLAIIQINFDGDERAKALGIFGSVIGVAAVAGQILGGSILALDLWHLEWRPIFLVNVPIGLLALVVGWIKLPRVSGHDVPVPNLSAAALITAGIATLTFGIVKLNDWGWDPPAVALSFAAAAAMLALFVAHCLRSDNPFVDPVADRC